MTLVVQPGRSETLLSMGEKMAIQARQRPLTAKAVRAWLALAVSDADRRGDGRAAKRLAELEVSIV